VRAEVLAGYPHCHVVMTGKWDNEWRPLVPNPRLIPVQCLPNIGTDTRKVDVQLVLRAAHSRVNCQANVISRKRLAQCLVDMSSSFPGAGEIVRCPWPTNDRALDTGDSSCRNKQKLIAPSRVPEDRESGFGSPAQIDFKAGLGVVVVRLPRDTYVVHNFPQGVSREASLSCIGHE